MKLLLISLFIFCSSNAFAFINVETLRQSHKNGFFGSTNLKVTGQSGSTDSLVNDFSTQNIYRSDENEFLFFLTHRYGEVSNTKNTDKGSFHLRYSRALSKRMALEFYGQVEFDKFRALKLRRLYGTGVRVLVAEGEKAAIYFGAGAFYENEDLDNDPDEETARGNIYVAYSQKFTNKMVLTSTLYYQPSLSYSDFRVQMNSGLGVPLTKRFKLTIELQAAHDSAPPTGIVKTDTLYLTGIAFSY